MPEQNTQPRTQTKWSLSNLPPEGHPEVGTFVYSLFVAAKAERERLGVPERLMENHRLFRGKHWDSVGWRKDDLRKVTVNLFFANVTRTVANITANYPQAEVVEVVGTDVPMVPGAATSGVARNILTSSLSAKLRADYNETEQDKSLTRSATNMEVYGITIEKTVWNPDRRRPEVVIVDPYAFFPAPGFYSEVNDCPYLCHAYPMRVDEVESLFNVTGVRVDEVYSVLGEERDENRPYVAGTKVGTRNYPSNYAATVHPAAQSRETLEQRSLVIEVWLRDYSMDTTVDEFGNVIDERPKYPGGLRVVTIANCGEAVLLDRPNPNVNAELDRSMVTSTYLYDRFPFAKANSYEDTTSIWGFSAAEQVGDLNLKIDELVSRIANYLGRLMLPTLILPKDTGITLDMLNNRPGLVLQPVNYIVAQGIKYLQPPNLPSNFLELLSTYISFFDRVSQIEDADRGSNPGGVIAASAIVALQERGAVLMRAKIRAIDHLVRERGRMAVHFYQHFGLETETVETDEGLKQFRGVDLAPLDLQYIVESGSTVHKTVAAVQQQATQMYQLGAIDRQALLEVHQFPGWRDIIERVAEGQLGQALQILMQAGLPEEDAAVLHQMLMQPQQRKASPGEAGRPSAPGIPQAMQGSMADATGGA